MKKYSLSEEQLKMVVSGLNGIQVVGIEQARKLAFVAAVLDEMNVEEVTQEAEPSKQGEGEK